MQFFLLYCQLVLTSTWETEMEMLEDAVQNIPLSRTILGNVIEKKFHVEKYEFDHSRASLATERGFPKSFESSDVAAQRQEFNNMVLIE